MIKSKIISRFFFFVIAVVLLSAFTTKVTKTSIISKENIQSESNVSGVYEFQTSFLQSTANFKADGTFEMSYSLGGEHVTSGTWTIKKDILILKNKDAFPANKKWLIKDDKLYPILKSSKEYDMAYFYISKKE